MTTADASASITTLFRLEYSKHNAVEAVGIFEKATSLGHKQLAEYVYNIEADTGGMGRYANVTITGLIKTPADQYTAEKVADYFDRFKKVLINQYETHDTVIHVETLGKLEDSDIYGTLGKDSDIDGIVSRMVL